MRKWATALVLLSCVLLVAAPGCASKGKKDKEAKEALVEVDFFDSTAFDSDLSKALKRDPDQVVVTVPKPFDLNAIPERMDNWLGAVQDGDGRVTARAKDGVPMRGVASEVITVGIMVGKAVKKKLLYRPAKEYDATLLYGEDGNVEQVVLIRRN